VRLELAQLDRHEAQASAAPVTFERLRRAMISYKGYTGVFEYDETIDALAGYMVDIAGEIYFEGRSVEEVKESARRAVDHYLRACEVRGVNPDRPYSGKIKVSTSPEVHRARVISRYRST
jgi:predicted HicB family RNase H-like nuclease